MTFPNKEPVLFVECNFLCGQLIYFKILSSQTQIPANARVVYERKEKTNILCVAYTKGVLTCDQMI